MQRTFDRVNEISDRLIDTAHLFHLLHDTKHRIDECENKTCKQNVEIMRKYKLHVPESQ